MMDPVLRVQNIFKESIDLQARCSDLLTPAIVRAAELVTSCLINERKILSCGNGSSAAEAQKFSGQMIN
ncbi:MAG: SIS domain-containing protein, partial [Gammaproteobacteria bacterium]